MLPEMKYIEEEHLPMLREHRAARTQKNADKQLRQWRGEKGVCSLLLQVIDPPEAAKLPRYNNYEIHFDVEKMFVSQLRTALGTALAEGDGVPSVRANVGCGAINTLLGDLKQELYPDKMPWLQERLTPEQIMEFTADDLHDSPEFAHGLEEMRFMKEMLRGTGIEVFPMDLQGPIDMAHLWLGDDFFYDLYDEPELCHKALSLAVEAETYAMKKCFEIIEPTDHVCHYNNLVLPAATPLKISEDTSTLICKEHLDEYMFPYTEKMLARFGGGYIHYCGNNPHLLKLVPTIPHNIGMNFGNPERHNAKEVLATLGALGKCYYGNFKGVPMQEQIAFAHREDGRFNIFLTAVCKCSEQEKIIEEFNQAVEG